VYVDSPTWTGLTPEGRVVTRLRAFAATADATPLFCHRSAAVLHGLPLLDVAEFEVHIVGRTVSGGRRNDGVHRHAPNWSWSTGVEIRHGLQVTSLPRTMFDLAGALLFPEAVVVCDAGLRAGADPAVLQHLAGTTGYRAVRRVSRAFSFASPLSESPGESLSRALIHELGLPAPLLQQAFRDRQGFIGRVDFWWPEQRVIGEFDGAVKYGSRLPGSPEDRLWQEKLREDRLRAVNPSVVRWVWDDLKDRRRLAALLAAAGVRP
jgi:hypothetical protein